LRLVRTDGAVLDSPVFAKTDFNAVYAVHVTASSVEVSSP
jgi:hypothetical protein